VCCQLWYVTQSRGLGRPRPGRLLLLLLLVVLLLLLLFVALLLLWLPVVAQGLETHCCPLLLLLPGVCMQLMPTGQFCGHCITQQLRQQDKHRQQQSTTEACQHDELIISSRESVMLYITKLAFYQSPVVITSPALLLQ
jgi:hypothetical protein